MNTIVCKLNALFLLTLFFSLAGTASAEFEKGIHCDTDLVSDSTKVDVSWSETRKTMRCEYFKNLEIEALTLCGKDQEYQAKDGRDECLRADGTTSHVECGSEEDWVYRVDENNNIDSCFRTVSVSTRNYSCPNTGRVLSEYREGYGLRCARVGYHQYLVSCRNASKQQYRPGPDQCRGGRGKKSSPQCLRPILSEKLLRGDPSISIDGGRSGKDICIVPVVKDWLRWLER